MSMFTRSQTLRKQPPGGKKGMEAAGPPPSCVLPGSSQHYGSFRRLAHCVLSPMNVRDYLTLAAIIAVLALMLLVTQFSQPDRAKPGSPEYVAYIEHYVDECLHNFERYNRGRPLPPEPARQAACSDFVLQADRFNPAARPLVHH